MCEVRQGVLFTCSTVVGDISEFDSARFAVFGVENQTKGLSLKKLFIFSVATRWKSCGRAGHGGISWRWCSWHRDFHGGKFGWPLRYLCCCFCKQDGNGYCIVLNKVNTKTRQLLFCETVQSRLMILCVRWLLILSQFGHNWPSQLIKKGPYRDLDFAILLDVTDLTTNCQVWFVPSAWCCRTWQGTLACSSLWWVV